MPKLTVDCRGLSSGIRKDLVRIPALRVDPEDRRDRSQLAYGQVGEPRRDGFSQVFRFGGIRRRLAHPLHHLSHHPFWRLRFSAGFRAMLRFPLGGIFRPSVANVGHVAIFVTSSISLMPIDTTRRRLISNSMRRPHVILHLCFDGDLGAINPRFPVCRRGF